MNKIEQDFQRGECRQYYRNFKRKIQGYNPPSLCFQREDGTLATSNEENCEILATYFEDLLNCEKPAKSIRTNKPLSQSLPSLPPNRDEIKRHIKRLKTNKAPGEDCMIAELWKHAPEEAIDILHQTIIDIWDKEQLP